MSYQLTQPSQTFTLDRSRAWYSGVGSGINNPYKSTGEQYRNFSILSTGNDQRTLVVDGGDNIQFERLTLNNVVLQLNDGGFYGIGNSSGTAPGYVTMKNATINFGADGDFGTRLNSDVFLTAEFGSNAIIGQDNHAYYFHGAYTVEKGANLDFVDNNLRYASTQKKVDFNLNGGTLNINNSALFNSGYSYSVPLTVIAKDNAILNLRDPDTGDAINTRLSLDEYQSFGSTINLINDGNTFEGRVIAEDGTTAINIDAGSSFDASLGLKKGRIDIVNNGSLLLTTLSTLEQEAIHVDIKSSQDIDMQAINIAFGSSITFNTISDTGNLQIDQTAADTWGFSGGSTIAGHFDANFIGQGWIVIANPILSPGTASRPTGDVSFTFANKTIGLDSFIFDMELNPLTDTNDKVTFNGARSLDGAVVVKLSPQAGISPTDADWDGKSFTLVEYTSGSNNVSYGADTSNMPAHLGYAENTSDTAFSVDVTAPTTQAQAQQNIQQNVQKAQAQQSAQQSSQTVASLSSNAQSALPKLPISTTTPPSNPNAATLQTAAQSIPVAQAAQQIDSLHAEPVSSHLTINLQQADAVIDSVLSHHMNVDSQDKLQAFALNAQPSTYRMADLWVQVDVRDGDIDAGGQSEGFGYELQSLVTGVTVAKTPSYHAGVFFGASKHKMDEHDAQSTRFDSDGFSAGVYAQKDMNQSFVDVVLGYGSSTTDSKRTTFVGSGSSAVSETPEAEYDTETLFAALKYGHQIYQEQHANGDWAVTPFVGYRYISSTQDAFVEKNAAVTGLTVDETEAKASIASLGIELEHIPSESSGYWATTSLRYDHDFDAASNSDHQVTAAFTHTPGVKSTYVGQNRGQSAVVLGVSVAAKMAGDGTLGLGGSYSAFENGSEKEISLNYVYPF